MNINVNASALTTISNDSLSQAKSNLVSYYQDFRSELGKLMDSLSDPNQETITLNGKTVDKAGTAATVLIQQFEDDRNSGLSQLLDIYKFNQTLENKLNNISFS